MAVLLFGTQSQWPRSFDAILLGDGEEALVEMCECVRIPSLKEFLAKEIFAEIV